MVTVPNSQESTAVHPVPGQDVMTNHVGEHMIVKGIALKSEQDKAAEEQGADVLNSSGLYVERPH